MATIVRARGIVLAGAAAAFAGLLGAPRSAAAQAQPGISGGPSTSIRVNGEAQFRYVFDRRWGGPPGTDSANGGFQLKKVRLVFSGWLLTPKLTFRVRPNYDRTAGTLGLDDAWAGYGSDAGLRVVAGQFKPAFMREEVVDVFNHLPVERSYVADYFTISYTQGVEVTLGGHRLRPSLAVHDGSYGANTDFSADRSDYAVVSRLEWLAAGPRSAFASFDGWSGTPPSFLLAAGADYERGQVRTGKGSPDVFKYSVDASFAVSGASAFAALYAQKFTVRGDATASLPTSLAGARQTGVVLQGAAFATPDHLEFYARFEQLNFRGVYYRNNATAIQTGSRNLATDRFRAYTLGAAYYFARDASKLSFDVVLSPDPVPVDAGGDGLLRNDAGRQLVVRTQYQIRF